MKKLRGLNVSRQQLIVAAIVMLTAGAGCKRTGNDSVGAAMNASGVMNGNAATGSTADTSSGAAAAADTASTSAAAAAASGASQ